jgi:Cu(I)/Ag(I) efflux system membrane fusion protein
MSTKAKSFLIIGIPVLLLAAAGVVWLARPNARSHQPGGTAGTEKVLYTCGMDPQVIQDHPGNCPICGMRLTRMKRPAAGPAAAVGVGERKIKYWRAPMDPNYISDKPGKSPMGLDLIPV